MPKHSKNLEEALYYFPMRENTTYVSDKYQNIRFNNTQSNSTPVAIGNYFETSGYAMRHHATSSYRLFDKRLFPIGAKSVRFKIRNYTSSSAFSYDTGIFGEVPLVYGEGDYGLICYIPKGSLVLTFALIKDGQPLFTIDTAVSIVDNTWHDVLFTWDGSTQENGVNLYYDGKLISSTRAEDTESNVSSCEFYFGKTNQTTQSVYNFPHYITDLEIYDKVITPFNDRALIFDDGYYKYHNGTSWVNVGGTEQDYMVYGMENFNHITSSQWGFLKDNAEIHIWTDDKTRTNTIVEYSIDEKSIKDELGETFTANALIQADTPNGVAFDETVPTFDIYDKLGEEIVLYVDNDSSSKDVIVDTQILTTDIYELYDELEVLSLASKKNLSKFPDGIQTIVNSNYTPLDLFEEDYEIVSIGSKNESSYISIDAIPAPQFTKLLSPKKVYGYLNEVNPVDFSQGYREDLRFVFGNGGGSKWYVWSALHNKFIQVMVRNEEEILKNGMRASQVQAITEEQWRTWDEEYVNIGIYLKNNPRGTIVSEVDSISYTDYLPRFTSTLSSADFNIINTTAHLTMSINGTTIKGLLGDIDGTKTQYRVLVNNNVYFPEDGGFSDLKEGEQLINLTINSKVVTIGDWNNVKVEFRDSFGTIEYWSTNFIGTYTGIMFKDIYGSYFTSDVGELLQYLDFGVIVAGQTTLEHEIILKNQYGYDVQNLYLYSKYREIPSGLEIQFSKRNSPFQPEKELLYDGIRLNNNEELSFFIRLKTELGSTPDAHGEFAIVVTADKVE